MTAPSEGPASRSLDGILDDLDDHLAQIRDETYLVIDAVKGAKTKRALSKRLKVFAKTVEDLTHKGEVCSTEAFDIARKVSAVLNG